MTVATSDNLEQMIVMQQGGLRMSARELENKINQTHTSTMKLSDSNVRIKVRPLEDIRNFIQEEDE